MTFGAERLDPYDMVQDKPADVKGCPDWDDAMRAEWENANSARSAEDAVSQAPIPVDFE